MSYDLLVKRRLARARSSAPSPANLLFDWEPARDLYSEAQGHSLVEVVGTPELVVANGLVMAEFDGSSYLVFESPIGSLSDAGDLSFYVVCERTDANVSAQGIVEIDDGDGAGVQHAITLFWSSPNNYGQAALASASGQPAATTQTGDLTRNQLLIVSGHYNATGAEFRVNGTDETNSGGSWGSTDPTGLTRLTIGASGYFGGGLGYEFIGRIARVLVYREAYNSKVVS